MKIFTCKQIREIDAATITAEPVSSINLMERAANMAAGWLMERFSSDRLFMVFCGPGNNGGDGLAIARLLHDRGFRTQIYRPLLNSKLSDDCEKNLKRVESIPDMSINRIRGIRDFPEINMEMVIVDALFGSGLSRPVDGLVAEVINKINSSDSTTIAIDIPSGLFGEGDGAEFPVAIMADHTLSFEFQKLGFMFPSNERFVGEVSVLPIGLNKATIENTHTPYGIIDIEVLSPLLKYRKRFSHKGDFGHALFIGGSQGKMGAVILGTKAALRTGAGLVTCHIPSKGNDILQIAVPEAMVSADWSDFELTGLPDISGYSSVGAGPGMGTSSDSFGVVQTLIRTSKIPMVLDADALNIISLNKGWVNELPFNTIITPHPKEFERLAGKWNNDYDRLRKQIDFSVQHGIIVVLKGANSSITFPGGSVWFNSTGNPGMSTAGSGDVLTGIILSLLAQNYLPEDATILGVYIHGLAGDIAAEKIGEESIIATDIIDNIASALILLFENRM